MNNILFFIDSEKKRELIDNESREIFDFVILALEGSIPPEQRKSFSSHPPSKAWFLEILGGCSASGWRLAYSLGTGTFWIDHITGKGPVRVTDRAMIVHNVITEEIHVTTLPLSELIGHDKKYSTRNLETVFIGA